MKGNMKWIRKAVWGYLWRLMSWIGQHELAVLVTLLVLVGGTWGFVELADEVFEGNTRAFDRAVLLAMRNSADPSDPIGPKWFEELMRDFTALGGFGILSLMSVAVLGYLVLQRKKRIALFVIAAVGGGIVLSTAMKQLFERPRPDLVPHGSYVYTTSFPSGHSMVSAVAYLTLGALVARSQPQRRLKAYILMVAVLLTGAVGISRIYLGVHWPTDVFAGWTAGVLWALLCWLIARALQRHGQIEQDTEEPAPSERTSSSASVRDDESRAT